MSGNNDDEKLPDVARRRGNADTLFSADWFEDEDEDAAEAEEAPGIAPPAMYQPPKPEVKPTPPPAAPPAVPPPAPPPPPKRLSNPTILPDFDLDDDEEDDAPPPPPVTKAPEPPSPPAAKPAVNEPEPTTAKTNDDVLPDIAKRRGNADTLFSADWFDDDGGDDDEAPESSAEPASSPAPSATSAPISAPVADEEVAASGNKMLYVAAGVGLLVLTCAGIGTGLMLVAFLS